MAGQIGEKEFEFLLAGKRGGHGIERGHILAEPMDVGGFSSERHVLAAKDIAESFDGELEIHNDVSLTGRIGQRLSQSRNTCVNLRCELGWIESTNRQSLNKRRLSAQVRLTNPAKAQI